MAHANIEQFKAHQLLGCFRHAETKVDFEFYANATGGWLASEEYPHMICLRDGNSRYARVLKTVTYVVVDEDDNGNPVVEKWPTNQYRSYAA